MSTEKQFKVTYKDKKEQIMTESEAVKLIWDRSSGFASMFKTLGVGKKLYSNDTGYEFERIK